MQPAAGTPHRSARNDLPLEMTMRNPLLRLLSNEFHRIRPPRLGFSHEQPYRHNMKPWGQGRLFAKLYGGFLAVALTGLVFAEALVDRRIQNMERTQVEERLSYIALMLGQMSAEALFGPIDA